MMDGGELKAMVGQLTEMEASMASMAKLASTAEHLINFKHDGAKTKLKDILEKLSEAVTTSKQNAEFSLEQQREQHYQELMQLKADIKNAQTTLMQLKDDMFNCPGDSSSREHWKQQLDNMEAQIRQAAYESRMTSLHNFKLWPSAVLPEIEQKLNDQLTFVQTCALAPGDISLQLTTSLPAVGAGVFVDVVPNRPDCRFASKLTVNASNSANTNVGVNINADNNPGRPMITLFPSVCGDYKLSVRLYGQHISNSPFSVHVLEHQTQISPILTNVPHPLSFPPPPIFSPPMQVSQIEGSMAMAYSDRNGSDMSLVDLRPTNAEGWLSPVATKPKPKSVPSLRGHGRGMPSRRELVSHRAQHATDDTNNSPNLTSNGNGTSSYSQNITAEVPSEIENEVDLLEKQLSAIGVGPDSSGGAHESTSTPSIVSSGHNAAAVPVSDMVAERAQQQAKPRPITMDHNNRLNETGDWDDNAVGEDRASSPDVNIVDDEDDFMTQREAPAPAPPSPQEPEPVCNGAAAAAMAAPPVAPKPDLVAMYNQHGKGIVGRRMFVIGISGQSDPIKTCLNKPMGCSWIEAERLWLLCDSGHNAIKLFDEFGFPKFMFGDGRVLKTPSDAKLVPRTNEIVVKDDHGLKIFNRDGNLVQDLARLNRPMGLVLYSENEVITLSDANLGISAEIQLYDVAERERKDRLPYSPVDALNDEAKRHSQPRFIDVQGNTLIVTDLGRDVLKAHKISLESGETLLSFGDRGPRPGQWLFPSGIQIDGAGNMLIGDAKNNRIQLFDSTGKFVCPLTLEEPGSPFVSNICLTSEGKLMVSCRRSGLAVVYNLEAMK